MFLNQVAKFLIYIITLKHFFLPGVLSKDIHIRIYILSLKHIWNFRNLWNSNVNPVVLMNPFLLLPVFDKQTQDDIENIMPPLSHSTPHSYI